MWHLLYLFSFLGVHEPQLFPLFFYIITVCCAIHMQFYRLPSQQTVGKKLVQWCVFVLYAKAYCLMKASSIFSCSQTTSWWPGPRHVKSLHDKIVSMWSQKGTSWHAIECTAHQNWLNSCWNFAFNNFLLDRGHPPSWICESHFNTTHKE